MEFAHTCQQNRQMWDNLVDEKKEKFETLTITMYIRLQLIS